MKGNCGLCLRESHDISKHHLIPRACHKTKWFEKRFSKEEMGRRGVMVCRECHHAIHDAVPKEKDLGRHYNTVELLSSHPHMVKHIAWMRKKYKTNEQSSFGRF